MKEINYNDYPTLLFTSFNKEDAPNELPFEVKNEGIGEYLSWCEGFKGMFGYIAACNSIEKKNTTTNFTFDDAMFRKIDRDDNFRYVQFRQFFENYVKAKHGSILLKEGGTYVYLLLGQKETKALKKMDGRYICTAFFKSNYFIGFEEAFVTDQGLRVLNTGYYDGGMDAGGYLSFVVVTLSYAHNKELKIYDSETVKETIYILE